MKAISYLRVSTARQGESGLGLEAQRSAVEGFLRQNGAELVHEYVEIESGKRADRPELIRALAHAKRARALLVVAKFDRLARNVAFLAKLLESGVEFVAADNPHANRLTVHILAAVAEAEARQISDRTRAALAAYRARGGKLGGALPQCRNLTAKARQKGQERAAAANRQLALEAYADLFSEVLEMRKAGRTLAQIAEALNAKGYTTRRGKPWNTTQVKRVLARAEDARIAV